MAFGRDSVFGAVPPSGTDNGWVPFGRYARLRAMAEWLRAENWPIVNSLQERSEADPTNESVLDHLPAPGLLDADH